MKISTRLRLAVFVPALMALVIIVALVFSYQDMGKNQETGDTVRQIRSSITELNHFVFSYVFYHEERPEQQFLAEHDALTGLIASAQVQNPDQQRLLDSIREDSVTMKDLFLQLVSGYEGGDTAGAEDRLTGLLLLRSYEVDTSAALLRDLLDASIRNTQVSTTGLIFLVLVLTTVPLTIVLRRTRRSITSSLSNLSKGAAVIGSGNLDFRIEEKGSDEITDLSRAFNRMTADLRTVTASKTDLEKEIDERKKTQEALKKSEEKYRTLFSTMSEGFGLHEIILDADGKPCDYRFLELNDAFEKLTGLSRDKVVGKTVKEVLPDVESYWIETYGRVALTGEPAHFENYSAPLDRWYGTYIYSTRENQFAVLFGDITERKKAEEALRDTRDYLDNLINYANAPIIVWDPSLNITRFNRAFERLTGHATDEVLGKKLDILFPDESREASMELIRKAIVGERWEVVEIPILNQDGTVRIVLWNSATLYASDGKTVIATIAQGQDITERKKAEEELKRSNVELEASNKELEAFSYSVSHDLRAPLRSMEGFSSAMLEDYAEKLDGQGKQYLRYIQDSSDLMARLIDDLLKLSRVTRSDMSYEWVNLSELARNIVAELEKAEPQRKVKLSIAPVMWAYGDRSLLRLALENLLGNAWKFSSKAASPRIEMGTLEYNSKQAYFVRDNGVGFDMTYADKLFKPFQRLHKSTEFAGTGIGLATVQRIIRRHGGEVWAESKVGEGATFYFTLG